jgi:hypothetical protein
VIEYGTGTLPEPRSVPLLDGTRTPNESLQVPGFVELIRNHPVVGSPLGLPAPLSTAEVVVIDVAGDVVAVGAAAYACVATPITARNRATRAIDMEWFIGSS